MGFASQLRTLREAAGLSQPALAERAGISVDSIQNWEQGRTRPRLEALGKLARALGATVDALLATDDKAADNPRPRGRPRKEQAAQLDLHATESPPLESAPGPTPTRKGRASRMPSVQEKPRERKARRARGS
jgi:transcriptional regulator with XRE-family HTH domain